MFTFLYELFSVSILSINFIATLTMFLLNIVFVPMKNQRNRYRGVMDALDMSAAVTAKVTKEFRSPSSEQMRLLLRYQL